MVIKVKRKPRTCLECGSRRVAVILWGTPDFSDLELWRKEREGRIVFGGCIVMGDEPRWECVDCGQQYDRLKN
jgi:hypothetical protein